MYVSTLQPFQMSQLFASCSQSIGVSASVLPTHIQDWFPLGWTGWIPLLSKWLSRVFSSTNVQFSRSVMSDRATPWIAEFQASLFFTNSWSLLKLIYIESVMPSKYLILCWPFLPPSTFPSIRVFSNESPSQPEGKIGLPRANPRGRLRSPS